MSFNTFSFYFLFILNLSSVNAQCTSPTPDYELYGGRYYKVVKTPNENWDTAKHNCIDDGAQLVVVESFDDGIALQELLTRGTYVKN